MNAARWLAAAAGALLVLIAGDVASEEIRARLDRLPFAVLRLARARLPAALREQVHDQEWLPELDHILKHAELFPLTRLLTGLRYATGLLLRAGTVAAELVPPGAGPATGGTIRQRLAAWSGGVVHALVWPGGQPLRVRLYLSAVATAAAAATGTAAAVTAVHARDLELFTVLAACAVAAHRPSLLGPLSMDLNDIWVLPAAVLLPPLYALIAPAAVFSLQRRRLHIAAYRRVFASAANGLAFGAASWLAHAAAAPAAGHTVPPRLSLLTWTLILAGCYLLAAGAVTMFLLTAIKATTPAVRVLPLAASPAAVRYWLANLSLGTAATLAAAANPLLVLLVIPAAATLTRHLAASTPAPPATA